MVEATIPRQAERLLNVQIMRAVAALMVAFLHFQEMGLHNPAFSTAGFHRFNLISLGAGVDIFFVISGFIITIASRTVVERRDVKEFLRRRLVRIAPLYWLVLSAWLVLIVVKSIVLGDLSAASRLTLPNIAGSYLFFPVDAMGYGPKYPFPILDLGWTLNFEMLFYVVFASCMVFGSRFFHVRLALGILALIVLGMIMPSLPLPWSFWTYPITLEFLAGVAIALAYRAGVRLPVWARIGLVVAGLLVWILVRETTFGPIPTAAMGSYSWPRVLSGGAGAILIMTGVTLGQQQFRGWLARRMGDLGDSSYALYLTHVLTLTVWRTMLEALPFEVTWSWPLVLAMVASAVAAAHLVHLFVERPMTDLLNRISKPRPAAPEPA